jgi:hypothetical protein
VNHFLVLEATVRKQDSLFKQIFASLFSKENCVKVFQRLEA